MALIKKTYTDGETIITAQNLNDIQDEIIAQEANKVPITRTVNNKQLNQNISLTASDVGAVPTGRKVNNKALSSDVTINASDIPNDSTVSGTKVDDALETLDSDIDALSGVVDNINIAKVQTVTVAETDLDSYTNGGIYYFQGAYTPSNLPTDAGTFGFLIVLKGQANARLVQYWIDSATSKNAMWMRTNSTSTVSWSDWKRMSNGDLTAKEITPTIVETLPTGVTAVGGLTVIQSGNVVTVSLALTRDSNAITTYQAIASGLPIPKKRPMSGSTTIPFGQLCVASSTQGRPLNVSIGSTGNLSVTRGEVAGQYLGTFTYITDEI